MYTNHSKMIIILSSLKSYKMIIVCLSWTHLSWEQLYTLSYFFIVNESKTKDMITTSDEWSFLNVLELQVDNQYFEKASEFTYLGAVLTEKNGSKDKINAWLTAGNIMSLYIFWLLSLSTKRVLLCFLKVTMSLYHDSQK